MSTVEKFITGVLAIGLITTLILPGRNSVGVINALFGGSSKLLATSIQGKQA